jgi:hypothetical protein
MSQRTGTVRATSNPCWGDTDEGNAVRVTVDALRANGSLHVSIWSEQHGMGLADQEVRTNKNQQERTKQPLS